MAETHEQASSLFHIYFVFSFKLCIATLLAKQASNCVHKKMTAAGRLANVEGGHTLVICYLLLA